MIGATRASIVLTSLLLMAPSLGEDPVGVWKGVVKGAGPIIPPKGVPASFHLRTADENTVEGHLSFQGFDVISVTGTFDSETGEVGFETSFNGVPLTVSLTIAGDDLTGTLSGMGMTMDVEAKRISHEVLDEPPAPSAAVDPASLTRDEWSEDLEFLQAYLPQVHANAFHTLTTEQWKQAVADVEARLDELTPRAKVVALAQLVARVGDAHTGLQWREASGFTSVPIRFGSFADGIFVIGVDERWADALCARVTRVGSTSVEKAVAAVSTVFASENDAWKRAQVPILIVLPGLLTTLGLLESSDRLPLTVEDADGNELELVVEREGIGNQLRAPDPEYDPVPLWRTRTNELYWFEVLDEHATVYFAYNACAEDPRRPMAAFIEEILEAVDLIEAQRLVIDLRNNSGGNSLILSQHIGRFAQHERLGQPGRTFALIGPATYSSGMMNAHQLREGAGFTLVGEPTGGKPNSYGEVRSFRLPNSGLRVMYSTKYFQMLESDPPAIEPDVLVEVTADDHFGGHDPVLARVLEE